MDFLMADPNILESRVADGKDTVHIFTILVIFFSKHILPVQTTSISITTITFVYNHL